MGGQQGEARHTGAAKQGEALCPPAACQLHAWGHCRSSSGLQGSPSGQAAASSALVQPLMSVLHFLGAA